MGGVLFLAGAVCFWFSCHVPWLVLSASMAGALVFENLRCPSICSNLTFSCRGFGCCWPYKPPGGSQQQPITPDAVCFFQIHANILDDSLAAIIASCRSRITAGMISGNSTVLWGTNVTGLAKSKPFGLSVVTCGLEL